MSAQMASIETCTKCRQYYAECVCGTEYAPRGCAEEGCEAILYYPDEGDTCPAHTCEACGVSIGSLEVFPLPWRDTAGMVYLDNGATSCVRCYAKTMETLPLGVMLQVGYKQRA